MKERWISIKVFGGTSEKSPSGLFKISFPLRNLHVNFCVEGRCHTKHISHYLLPTLCILSPAWTQEFEGFFCCGRIEERKTHQRRNTDATLIKCSRTLREKLHSAACMSTKTQSAVYLFPSESVFKATILLVEIKNKNNRNVADFLWPTPWSTSYILMWLLCK